MPLRAPRQRRLLPVLLTLAVALGLAVLPSTGASAETTDPAAGPEATRVTVKLSRSWGVYYDGIGPAIPEDTFVVSGDLVKASDGTPLAGQPVELQRAKKTATVFSTIAETTTDADGHFVFRQRVVGTADYGTSYAGDGVSYAPSKSRVGKRLKGMRDFNAGKRRVNGKLYLRGTVKPYWNNRKVTLQRKTCGSCAWRTITSRRTGAQGAWSFPVSYPRKVGPVWRWQVVLAAAGDFDRSFSSQLTTSRAYGRAARVTG